MTLIAPLLNQIIYPYVDRHIAKVTNLRKCVGSMLLATLAFAMSGGIQLVIDMQTGHGAAGGSDVSIFWQLPQILAISFAEPMCLIPLYDWTYNQSPDDMKATYSGIFLAMAGLGDTHHCLLFTERVCDCWNFVFPRRVLRRVSTLVRLVGQIAC